jgi:hypothetical protein
MLRRCFLTVALAVCAVAPVWAQARATYVLTNGERHNGLIVYGRGENNIVDGKFHANNSGRELVFEMDDVVVIDFAGDTPTTAELEALPNGTQLMVLRNGSTQRGSLTNLIKGDFVQWVNEAGQRNNIPISDVRRLYLKPDSARTSFFSTGQRAAGTTGQGLRGSAATVRVDGNQQWVDTGIDVMAGQRLTITATGQVQYAPGATVSAAGAPGASPANYPIPSMGGGGLIGKVGDGAPFIVGAGSRTITSSASGRLMLGINDDIVSDNSGAFNVTIRKR